MKDHESFYIPAKDKNHIDTIGELHKCPKCNRKIVIWMASFGSTHHSTAAVECADCMVINEEFRKEFPSIVKRIEDWMADKELGPQYVYQDKEELDLKFPYVQHTPVRPGTLTGIITTNDTTMMFNGTADGRLLAGVMLVGKVNYVTGELSFINPPDKVSVTYEYEAF